MLLQSVKCKATCDVREALNHREIRNIQEDIYILYNTNMLYNKYAILMLYNANILV